MIKNWDEVKELQYVQEEGEYTFTIKAYETGESANGNEYHKYTCETADGESLNVSFYLTDKALWKYKMFVKALGLPTTGLVDFESLPSTLVGKQFVGEVTQRTSTRMNAETGAPEEKTYFEISKFHTV